MATENQFDSEKSEASATSETLETRRLRMHQALESIRASIIANRGSLNGILDEFLAERRAEVLREWNE